MAKTSSVLPFIINVVNTAFGVTVLAVPYCFHQVSRFKNTIKICLGLYFINASYLGLRDSKYNCFGVFI
jgi:hypothetical protein